MRGETGVAEERTKRGTDYGSEAVSAGNRHVTSSPSARSSRNPCTKTLPPAPRPMKRQVPAPVSSKATSPSTSARRSPRGTSRVVARSGSVPPNWGVDARETDPLAGRDDQNLVAIAHPPGQGSLVVEAVDVIRRARQEERPDRQSPFAHRFELGPTGQRHPIAGHHQEAHPIELHDLEPRLLATVADLDGADPEQDCARTVVRP